MKASLTALLCLTVFSAAMCAGADELELSYTIKFEQPETATAEVTASISGLESEGLKMLRPAAAAPGWFDILGARDSSGRELKVASTEGGYYITTGESPRVTLTYTIFPGTHSSYGYVGLICSDYAALDGSQVFLLPGDDHRIKTVSLRHVCPAGWRPIISWPKVRSQFVADEAFAPLRTQLEGSLVCFGDFRRISRGFGTNTLSVHALESYGDVAREELAESLQDVYRRLYQILGFETGREYNVVCLPRAPDGGMVVAGAWCDGLALTLAATFEPSEFQTQAASFCQLLTASYFAEEPLGATLAEGDWWFYPAVIRYGECVGLETLGLTNENTFYGLLYTDYIAEASADNSQLDIPFTEAAAASPQALAFLRRVKAPILSMALDYRMRSATDGRVTLTKLIRKLFERDFEGRAPLAEVIGELTATDFSPFFDDYIRSRTLILPLWPSFVEYLQEQAETGPGPVAATVDGVPIYEREVQLMAASAPERATLMSREQRYDAALEMLVQEKMMDKALMQRRVRVVPEIFWQLRSHLPPKVLRVIITKKRQVLKELLYQEWQEFETEEAKVERQPAPQAGAAGGPS